MIGGELAPVALEQPPPKASRIRTRSRWRAASTSRSRRSRSTVLGDREALRTLVRNLVDNAVRYTPPGGRVRVRTRRASRRAAPCSR